MVALAGTTLTIESVSHLFSYCYKRFFKISNAKKQVAVEMVKSLCELDSAFPMEVQRHFSGAFLSVIYLRGFGVETDMQMFAQYATRYATSTFDWMMMLAKQIDELLPSVTDENEKELFLVCGSHVNYLLAAWHHEGIPNKLQANSELTFQFLTKSVNYFKFNPHALLHLGWCYSFGHGTARNKDLACEYYMRSAELKMSSAAFNVGLCYHGKKMYSNAAKWFKVAADTGLAKAQHNYAIYLMSGFGVNIDKKEAFDRFMDAAQQGNVDSMRKVGFFYTMGYDGVTNKDMNKAIEWYSKAAEAGDSVALSWLSQNSI